MNWYVSIKHGFVLSVAVIMADKKSKSTGVKRVLTKKEQEEIKKKVGI